MKIWKVLLQDHLANIGSTSEESLARIADLVSQIPIQRDQAICKENDSHLQEKTTQENSDFDFIEAKNDCGYELYNEDDIENFFDF